MKSKSSSLGGKWKAKGLYRVFLALHFRTWKITAPRKDERYKPENDAISESWRAPFIRFGIPRSSILVLCKLLVPSQENPMEFSFLDFFVCSGADFEIFRDERFSQEDHYEWFKDYTHFRHLLLQHMNSHSSVTFISCILIYALFEHQISVWICNLLNRYWSWDVGTLSCVKSCIKMGLLS